MEIDEVSVVSEKEEDEPQALSEEDVKYQALEMYGDDSPTSVLTRPYLSLLTAADFETATKTIAQWHYIYTEDLKTQVMDYECLTSQVSEKVTETGGV